MPLRELSRDRGCSTGVPRGCSRHHSVPSTRGGCKLVNSENMSDPAANQRSSQQGWGGPPPARTGWQALVAFVEPKHTRSVGFAGGSPDREFSNDHREDERSSHDTPTKSARRLGKRSGGSVERTRGTLVPAVETKV